MRSFRWLLLSCFLLVSTHVFAKGNDFVRLARLVESHYQVEREHIPLWGVIKPLFKAAHPLGANGVDMVVFEDLKPDRAGGPEELGRLVQTGLGPNWQPMVRVCSRRNGEQSLIYSKSNEKDFRLMILTLDSSGAVLLDVKLKAAQLAKWLHDPELIGRRVQHGVEDDLEE